MAAVCQITVLSWLVRIDGVLGEKVRQEANLCCLEGVTHGFCVHGLQGGFTQSVVVIGRAWWMLAIVVCCIREVKRDIGAFPVLVARRIWNPIESVRFCLMIMYRLVRAKVDDMLISGVVGTPCSTATSSAEVPGFVVVLTSGNGIIRWIFNPSRQIVVVFALVAVTGQSGYKAAMTLWCTSWVACRA